MPIKLQKKSYALLKKYLTFAMQTVNEEIIRGLAILGDKCVVRIKDRSGAESWNDKSGNLRSSIGYGIYAHGRKLLNSVFQQVKNGREGVQVGRDMIDALAQQYADTYALVVIAGMNYAEAVEECKNKDVLASTKLWAEGVVNEHLQKALERAMKKIEQANL